MKKRRWLSTTETAVALGVSRQRVNSLLLKNRIRGAVRVGPDGRWAIPLKIVVKAVPMGRPKKARQR